MIHTVIYFISSDSPKLFILVFLHENSKFKAEKYSSIIDIGIHLGHLPLHQMSRLLNASQLSPGGLLVAAKALGSARRL